MNLLEANDDQARPDFQQIQAMWQALEIQPVPFLHPAVQDVLAAFKTTHVNGGALFARFMIANHSTLHWFGARNRWDEINFFDRFFRAPPVRDALPDLQVDGNATITAAFEWGSAFTLDGEIAQALYAGGAYDQYRGTPRQAKDLGMAFCTALFGDRFGEVLVYRCYKPWSSWFYGIAWDATWIVIDKRSTTVDILCITDTD